MVLQRVVLLSAVALMAWIFAVVVIRLAHTGKVLPGTEVAGVDLGGTDREEALRRLRTLGSRDRTLTIQVGERRIRADTGELGFLLDVGRTLDRASAAGREGATRGVVSTVTRLVSAEKVAPVYAVDAERLRAWTRRLAQRVDRAAFAGALAIEPDSLKVRTVPPRRGVRLGQRRATEEIERALREGRSTARLALRRTATPPVAEVERIAAQARSYLALPITARAGERRRVLSRREVAGILGLEEVRGSARRVRLGARPAPLARAVERVASRTDQPAADARLSAPSAPVTLDDRGDTSWRPRRADVGVTSGRSGVRINRAGAADAIASAIRRGRHRVELPIEVTRPTVTTAAARRVRRVVGTFTTRYPCCEPRVQNIRRIARAVDGTVIAPGARFSLNGVAGPRTRAKGYVPAPFIADGKIVPSVGGGVSQFATTMFNAAYFAGLRLDTHQPHSFFIDRYPAGREATVDYTSIDLAWTNDTDAPILVRASSTPSSVTVTLYGDNGGRRVRARSSRRQRAPGRAFSITVTRIVRYGGGRVERQAYTTTYDRPPAED